MIGLGNSQTRKKLKVLSTSKYFTGPGDRRSTERLVAIPASNAAWVSRPVTATDFLADFLTVSPFTGARARGGAGSAAVAADLLFFLDKRQG